MLIVASPISSLFLDKRVGYKKVENQNWTELGRTRLGPICKGHVKMRICVGLLQLNNTSPGPQTDMLMAERPALGVGWSIRNVSLMPRQKC